MTDLRAAFEQMLAERERELREAERRPPPPHVGCCWCGVGVSDPVHRGVRLGHVPAWSLEVLGATCATCSVELLFLTEDEHRVVITQRLLGLPRSIPSTDADPIIGVAVDHLLLFRDLDLDLTEPNPTPWAHADVDALRAAYDVAVHADDPVYEVGEPCPGCGRSDVWLRVPPRQELLTQTIPGCPGDPESGVSSSATRDRVDVIEHPASLRCGRCLTWERV